jgi:hypothetical protein
MQFSESLLALAGFVFAHATWSVSDLLNGELLIPLAIVENSGRRRLLRFEAETQELAINKGKATLASLTEGAWAFAREGQIKEHGLYVDVLTIEAKDQSTHESVLFVQRFQPFSSGTFKLIGEPMVVVGGKALPEIEAGPILRKLSSGVQSHVKAAEQWSSWSK